MSKLDKRLNDLEVKFSYQDELINELNLIVANQQVKIDRMSEQLKNITEQSAQGSLSKDEKPPHY